MTRLIKRYSNRKMYDTHASRYVTLDEVAAMVRAGDDLRIIDNDSGDDLTAVIFAQIIFEEEKRRSGMLGLPVLRWIIQQGGATLQEILNGVDRGREALGSVRELAEKGMKHLAESAGVRAAGPAAPAARPPRRGGRAAGRYLLNDLLELPQKQLEQLQHRIDAQVRASLDRVAAHPTVQHELRRIEQSIRTLERRLSRLRRQGARTAHAAAARRPTPPHGGHQ